MAAATFNLAADPTKARAISAGTKPASHIHPEVLEAMRERGVDLGSATPARLTTELARDAALLVTMGCGEECPVIPGLAREDWPLDDPKGKAVDEVRRIRSEIEARVVALLEREGWQKTQRCCVGEGE